MTLPEELLSIFSLANLITSTPVGGTAYGALPMGMSACTRSDDAWLSREATSSCSASTRLAERAHSEHGAGSGREWGGARGGKMGAQAGKENEGAMVRREAW